MTESTRDQTTRVADRPSSPATAEGPPRAMLRMDSVSHSFITPTGQRMEVLSDVSISVEENEFFTVVGPSGCGKTTLLNIAVGLVEPAGGTVRHVTGASGGRPGAVGYITQDSNLLPWATVMENVMVPLEIRKVKRSERREQAAEWIRIVGLGGFEDHYPRQLSGGMQKRCAIARTMVYDPEIVFMDEPFGALDALTKTTMQKILLDLWQTRRKTIIFITHDLTEAIALSDRVGVMTGRPGTLKAVVPVPLGRPRDVYRITGAPGFESLRNELWSLLETDLDP